MSAPRGRSGGSSTRAASANVATATAAAAAAAAPPTPAITVPQTPRFLSSQPCTQQKRSDQETGRARVLEPPAASDCADGPVRVRVAFDVDGSTHAVRLARLTPVFGSSSSSTNSSGKKVAVVCATTDQYRRLARSQVTAADAVVEVGCSTGGCTALLARHAGRVVGVDNSQQLVREARARNPLVRFEHCDALAAPDELKALAESCGVAFVDIGGNRQLESLVLLLPWVLRELSPRLLVVKSEALAASAAAELERQQGDGGGDRGGAAAAQEEEQQQLQQQQQRQQPGSLADPVAWWSRLLQQTSARNANAVAAAANDDLQLVENPLYYKTKAKGFKGVHPMKFPNRVAPSMERPVCRPHNYATCHAPAGECAFDHEHCHQCLQPGHVARACWM